MSLSVVLPRVILVSQRSRLRYLPAILLDTYSNLSSYIQYTHLKLELILKASVHAKGHTVIIYVAFCHLINQLN